MCRITRHSSVTPFAPSTCRTARASSGCHRPELSKAVHRRSGAGESVALPVHREYAELAELLRRYEERACPNQSTTFGRTRFCTKPRTVSLMWRSSSDSPRDGGSRDSADARHVGLLDRSEGRTYRAGNVSSNEGPATMASALDNLRVLDLSVKPPTYRSARPPWPEPTPSAAPCPPLPRAGSQ